MDKERAREIIESFDGESLARMDINKGRDILIDLYKYRLELLEDEGVEVNTLVGWLKSEAKP